LASLIFGAIFAVAGGGMLAFLVKVGFEGRDAQPIMLRPSWIANRSVRCPWYDI
jgi:hypothetical protein